MQGELENEFYRFLEQSQQADREWSRRILKHYMPMFSGRQRVLDAGCGEGPFLAMLKAEGIHGTGVDRDPGMVRGCRDQGLDAIEGDLFEFLPHSRESFDGIFCSNLIEHLCAEDVVRLLRLFLQALEPGGVLVVTTPNAASPIVQLYEFWRDATHVRLYTPVLVEFLCRWVGFVDTGWGENPATSWELPGDILSTSMTLKELVQAAATKDADPKSLVGASLDEQALPLPRTGIARLRRRVADFWARQVMFEEFRGLDQSLAAVTEELKSLRATLTALLRETVPLSQSYTKLLTTPREVFVRGVKLLPEDHEGQ